MDIQIIIPEQVMDEVADNLVMLTREIDKRDPERVAHGCLGGEHGYGGHWSNETFEMRPFYWGDCDCGADDRESAWEDTHEHREGCYQLMVAADLVAAGGAPSSFSKTYIEGPKHINHERWDEIEDAIQERWCKHFGLTYPSCCAIHCTCGRSREYQEWAKDNGHTNACSLELPNFRHKRTGLEVRWYKYIGRGMEAKNVPQDIQALNAIFRECIASL